MIDLKHIQRQQEEFISWLEEKPGMINEKSKYKVTKKQALALISELYEVENEVKYVHKWWDNSVVYREKVLLELSDFLSHLSNVSNYLDIELITEEEITQVEDLEGQFLSLTRHVYELPYLNQKFNIKYKIRTIFREYLQLVYSLGFNIEELEEGYKKKLKSNYENPKFK